MDNYNNYKDVKDALQSEEISLPESLREENIKQMLDNATPSLRVVKNKKRNRRLVSFAACAAVVCLCVGGVFAAQNRMGSPELTDNLYPPVVADTSNASGSTTVPESSVKTEETEFLSGKVTYDHILSLAKSYAEKQSLKYTYNYSSEDKGFLSFFSDMLGTKNEAAVDMEIAEDGAAVMTTAVAVMTTAAPTADNVAPMQPQPESDESASESQNSAAGGSTTPEYGKTNVQVEGVDEADLIKNDGENLYLCKGNAVHIIRAYPADEMKELSVIVPKEQFDDELIPYYYADEMFLYNEYLCLLVSYYTEEWNNSRTMVLVYDVSDPANPVFKERFAQDGYYVSSRIAGGKLILVTSHDGFYTYNYTSEECECVIDEARIFPKIYDGTAEGVAIAEDSLSIVDKNNPTAFTVVSLMNMDDLTQPLSSQAVLGGGTEIFCTNENLFVARRCYDVTETYSDDGLFVTASSAVSTQIFSFSFADGKVTRLATGTVPGEPLNQFSMDEYNGYFRIAVTFGGDNGLYVLDSDLAIVGECERYGKDERIQSVRFLGDWAYVVTFRQTDPLFVMDLTDPTNPVIAGELKLPGFSAYLHPIGNDLLIGIGYGGTESGLDGSAKISLFDVSDPMNPVETDSLIHENASVSTLHKALCAVGDGSFLLPMYSYGTVSDYGYDVWVQESGALLHFAVEDKKLVIRNEFTCDGLYTNPDRATFIGEVAYAVSYYQTPAVFAFDMQSGDLLGTLNTSQVNAAYETSGWKHYYESEDRTAFTENGEEIVVMTSPAYSPGGVYID